MRSFVALAVISALSATPAVAEPPLPSTALPLLPVNGECRLTIGNSLASSLGPARVTLSLDQRGSGITVERDGVPGHGEGDGQARLTAGKSGIFDFNQRLGADHYVFNASGDGTALLEMLAGSVKLMVAPLNARENRALEGAIFFQASAPHFTVNIGDVTPHVAQMAQCGEWLGIANKAYFCARITVFQTNQGCPVSAWRMAARDEQQIDWVDVNRLKRDGTTIQFVIFTQHGTTAAIKQPADRMAAIRVVQGDCANHDYRSKMFATYGSDDKLVAMTVEQPRGVNDRLVDQDMEIACSGRWQSPVVTNPISDTADRFEQERARQNEGRTFGRY